jgi:hypothetical protein
MTIEQKTVSFRTNVRNLILRIGKISPFLAQNIAIQSRRYDKVCFSANNNVRHYIKTRGKKIKLKGIKIFSPNIFKE